MSKVLIVSDNHGEIDTLKGIISREKPLDLIIHCGDSELTGVIQELSGIADAPVYAVSGNCDVFTDLSNMVHFDYNGHHILVVHGHYDNVNYGTDGLYRKAKAVGADIVFFGHTHVPFMREEDEIVFANPGSTDKPRQAGRESTYMIMEIEPDKRPSIEKKYFI